jgi:hypothetical protein
MPTLEALAFELSRHPKAAIDRKLKDVLEEASSRMTDVRRDAVGDILDCGPEPGPRTIDERRANAGRRLGRRSPESFYKKDERPLLEELAGHIRDLLCEHRGLRTGAEQASAEQASAEQAAPPARADPDTPGGSPALASRTLATPSPPAPPGLSARAARRPRKWGRPEFSAAAVIVAFLGILAALFVLRALSHPTIDAADETLCGPTTAQLYQNEELGVPTLYMRAPNVGGPGANHGWSEGNEFHDEAGEAREVLHAGQGRLFAMSYENTGSRTANNVAARVTVPHGGSLELGSTCIYRHHNYSHGTQISSNALTGRSGLAIPNVAPGEKVYVTFVERLPSGPMRCGLSLINLHGGIAENLGHEANWISWGGIVRLVFETAC